MMTRRLLFVDDEPNLLMGLKRNLRCMRNDWDMEFVSSGEAALQEMAHQLYDVIITDMRMPGMTGAELLSLVQVRFPQVIRVVLSGQSDRESLLESPAPAHQFLSKPCDSEQLRGHLEQAIMLADLLKSATLKTYISRLQCILSMPALFADVAEELRATEPSPSKIGRIIARDTAMTARILQLVNSAVHSLRGKISDPGHAVLFLGIDTIQALVLSLSVFSAFGPRVMAPLEADQLWDHSLCTSRFSKAISYAEGIRGHATGLFINAGLLHDVGNLMMASANPKEFREIAEIATWTEIDTWLAEKNALRCSHADVGAYLLGIWGLPASIVEAVAWHHQPSSSSVTEFCPLAAVHAATAFHAQLQPALRAGDPSLDRVFLQRSSLADREKTWMKSCCELLEQGRLP